MNHTKPLNASNPAARIYELGGRRFIVSTESHNNAALPITELLLRVMLKDGASPTDKRDRRG